MPEHHTPLIATIAAGLLLAFAFGLAAHRLRIQPLAGYVLAGVVVSPSTPGFHADSALAGELAEIGVILLMFGVGLHFSLKDLMAVARFVVPGAIVQIVVVTLLGAELGHLLGWSWTTGLVFGLALSVASTVVMVRAFQDRHMLDTERGRFAVGWLVVEDLVTILTLVLLPTVAAMATGDGVPPARLAFQLLVTLVKVGIFVTVMLMVGRRVIPWLMHYTAHTGSRELFRLAVYALAIGVAFGAARLFDVSFALGAFFAGVVMGESTLSQQATEEALPLRDAFAVLFFVSVGMLFDPRVIVDRPLDLGLTFGIVLAGGGVCYVLLRLFGVQSASALTIAVSLTQIGEFSFILADLDIGLGVLPEEARGLILGASILSIFLNPLLFALAARREASPNIAPAPDMPRPAPERTKLTDHVVLVGYGRVGRVIADGIKHDLPLLVMEEGAVGAPGVEHIRGNAARDDVLAAANLPAAKMLFVAIPEAFEAGQIVQQARRANPLLPIVVRAHFDAEVEHLLSLGASKVVMGEREIALAMLDFAKSHGTAASYPST